jgi:predicted DNA-binding ribbon-helix-helix protein
MAKKIKGQGRTVYFKDSGLWGKLDRIAEEKKWSVNQVIQDFVEACIHADTVRRLNDKTHPDFK